jgi:hypothetical protein
MTVNLSWLKSQNLTLNNTQVKSKGHTIIGHEGRRGGVEGKLYSFSTSALEEGGWSAPRPGRFTSGKDPVPIVQEAGRAPWTVWTCAKNLAPHQDFLKIFVRILCFIVLVLNFQWSFVSYRAARCGFFQQENSDGFGRERTRDLGYQRPACKPLDHRSS